MIYLLTLLVLAALGFSIWREPRSLLNPFLLVLSLGMSYLALTSYAYEQGMVLAHDLLFGLGFIALPLGVLLGGVFLVYNGFVVLQKEGKSKANLLSLLLGLAIIAFCGLMYLRIVSGETFYTNSFLNIVYILIFFSFLVFGFTFAGFLLYTILYNIMPKKKDQDFIIIHGAGLLNGETVTPLLKKRIDKAISAFWASTNPNVKLISSGGQGPDEKVSEAYAMAQYALAQGIPAKKILLEDQSRTTYENLLYSYQLGQQEVADPTFLFVTNDYHVYRTSNYAKAVGMKGQGLGCRTASYYIPSAFIREYVALVVKLKWLFAGLYGLFGLGLIISYLPFNF